MSAQVKTRVSDTTNYDLLTKLLADRVLWINHLSRLSGLTDRESNPQR